jgi:hypothetical protein
MAAGASAGLITTMSSLASAALGAIAASTDHVAHDRDRSTDLAPAPIVNISARAPPIEATLAIASTEIDRSNRDLDNTAEELDIAGPLINERGR